jgi:hypothetical protein
MDKLYHEKIKELSTLFFKYKIYPKSSFENSFVNHFISTNQENYYSRDIIDFLSIHQYVQLKIGADLPWWGKEYFGINSKIRTFVIAQDSNSSDAGSVTFYANLMQLMNKEQYKCYVSKFQRFDGWILVKELFELCDLNMDYTYITDARKIYPDESLKYKDIIGDNEESIKEKARLRRKLLINKRNSSINSELLKSELKLCSPNVIIILGNSGLNLIDNSVKLTDILDAGCTLSKNGIEYLVAPFPSRASTIYEKYKLKAANIIRNKMKTL